MEQQQQHQQQKNRLDCIARVKKNLLARESAAVRKNNGLC